MRRARMISMAAGAVAAALMSPTVRAAGTAYTFTGANGANWTDPVWSPAGVPGVGDSATSKK